MSTRADDLVRARLDLMRAGNDRSRAAQRTAERAALKMKPAHRLELARSILTQLAVDGVDYEDFQNAQHAGRAIRKAARELRDVS